jgi:hypothetical protein
MNVKKYLEKRFRGWLPEEPNLNGIKRTMGRRNLAKPVMGMDKACLPKALMRLSTAK